MRYFLEIKKERDYYTIMIYRNEYGVLPSSQKSPLLSPEYSVSIEGEKYTLKEITDAFALHQSEQYDIHHHIINDVLQECGQVVLGIELYNLTFGCFPEPDQSYMFDKIYNNEPIDIRIVTDDSFIISLPWILLRRRTRRHKSSFLFLSGCYISHSPPFELQSVNFPENPRILIAAPDPYNNTDRKDHLYEIRECLKKNLYPRHEEEYLKIVINWTTLGEELELFQPDIFYYYGHGEGGMYHVRLIFENSDNEGEDEKPITDLKANLQKLIRKKKSIPKLTYFNCCKGNCGGLTGIGMQLEGIIPAVITNRSTAWIDEAREQALVFFNALLSKRSEVICPCKAMTEVYSKVGEGNFSMKDIKWLTPVLHTNYSIWNIKRQKEFFTKVRDPNRFLQLNRKESYRIVGCSKEMLERKRPRTYAFVWYGKPDQGIMQFHKKLEWELDKIKSNICYLTVNPQLPDEINNIDKPELSFRIMMEKAFYKKINIEKYKRFDLIKQAIREFTLGASDKQTLIYIKHHIPLIKFGVYNLYTIEIYLQWLNNDFIPKLEPSQFILLGFSFEVNNTEEFQEQIETQEERLYYKHIRYIALNPFKNITKKDIIYFLKDFYADKIPKELHSIIIKNIFKKTNGSYDATIMELKNQLGN